MYKISVIITTFNRQELLERAIESVLAQTYTNYNIIVVDDGSTDNTSTIKILNNPKIKYIQQQNQGTSAAKNTGIKNSSAPFIAFLDSDDTWEKDKLKIQLGFMEKNPLCQICYTDETWIRNGKTVSQRKKHIKTGGNIFNAAVKNCFIGISTVMIKRELFAEIGLFDQSMPVCEDYDLWLRIASAHKIELIEQKLTNKYALTHPQLSFSDYPMEQYRIQALNKILKSKNLTIENRSLVLKTMEQKHKIMLCGLRKRKHILKLIQCYLSLFSIKIKFYLFFCKKNLS